VPGAHDEVKEKSGTRHKRNLENTQPTFVELIKKKVHSTALIEAYSLIIILAQSTHNNVFMSSFLLCVFLRLQVSGLESHHQDLLFFYYTVIHYSCYIVCGVLIGSFTYFYVCCNYTQL
jgi:hypothetical protein